MGNNGRIEKGIIALRYKITMTECLPKQNSPLPKLKEHLGRGSGENERAKERGGVLRNVVSCTWSKNHKLELMAALFTFTLLAEKQNTPNPSRVP